METCDKTAGVYTRQRGEDGRLGAKLNGLVEWIACPAVAAVRAEIEASPGPRHGRQRRLGIAHSRDRSLRAGVAERKPIRIELVGEAGANDVGGEIAAGPRPWA